MPRHMSVQLGLIMSINRHKNTMYLVGVTMVPGPGRQWVGRRWCGMVKAGEDSLYKSPTLSTDGQPALPGWLQAGMRVIAAKISQDGQNSIISMIVRD